MSRDAVRAFYAAHAVHEWERADRHRTEFAVTVRCLAQHLPPPPARILDCGGGPGRYSITLARQGYDVTLFDLSPENLEIAAVQAAAAGVAFAAEQGDALDLSRYGDASFDAVLLMGPLYHLLEAGERERVLHEAYRVVRSGGPVFATFITRYAPFREGAARCPTEPIELTGLYEQIEATGKLPPQPGVQFVAYFADPDEVEPLLAAGGFEVVETLGVEGLISVIERYAVNSLAGTAWDWWLEANWRAAHVPYLRGSADHLLVVARRPKWKAAVKQLVTSLEAAGIRYCIVAGAATALHGAPVGVKDIDVALDRDGLYRAGELFAAHAVLPVKYRESEQWRSHFGRFDFDGVTVEMMAGLERRDGDGWVPSDSVTETVVDLEGVPVRAAWLEEEFLAYIRRGRLERAALILPRCDRGRLVALLRGEVKTQVL